jgi:hypothetical protein
VWWTLTTNRLVVLALLLLATPAAAQVPVAVQNTPIAVTPPTPAAVTYFVTRLSDGTSYLTPASDYTHDTALTPATTTGPIFVCRTANVPPSALSADDKASLVSCTRQGVIFTTEAPPTTVLNGQTSVTTAGTRVTLASSTAAKGVTVCAKSTNTGNIFLGSSAVTSANGRILRPGECQSLAISNLNTVNLDSAVNGEGVTYVGVN